MYFVTIPEAERQKVVAETSVLFDETKELIEQMSLEVQELSPEVKEKHMNRLACFQKELQKLSSEFKRPRYAPKKLNSKNISFATDEESLREEVLFDTDMRARLLDNTERMARSTGQLEDGVRVALQTEEVGSTILGELGEQREKLQRSRNRLRQADSDLNKSSRILSEMTRRVIQNRVLLIGIIFFVILIFVVAIYLISQRGSAPPVPQIQITAAPGHVSGRPLVQPESKRN
ncbi:unnamed protein product [Calicophoron daubneyi]|uniref:t-SNARE coiled-coil homology domain-containing protein n=1 Tax=Calicophoron daubneyi TaxID=300641 RepID=A0AAV2TTB2_CALDB